MSKFHAEGTGHAIEWTEEEDVFMKNVFTLGKLRDWSHIASIMSIQFPNKNWSRVECKKHWNNIMSKPDSKKFWSMRDELELLIVHKHCGNRWSAAAEMLKGRCNNSIKNRFYSIFRKVISKVKRMEVNVSCQIELLEVLYILSIMEVHAANPSSLIPSKKKRGTDFISTLMQSVSERDLSKYKTMITSTYGSQATLEAVWQIVAHPLEQAQFFLSQSIRKMIEMYEAIRTAQRRKDSGVLERAVKLPEIDFGAARGELSREEKEFIVGQAFRRTAPDNPEAAKAQVLNILAKAEIETSASNHSSIFNPKREEEFECEVRLMKPRPGENTEENSRDEKLAEYL